VCPAFPAPSISGKTTATSRWTLATTTTSSASKCLLPCVECARTRFTLITPKGCHGRVVTKTNSPTSGPHLSFLPNLSLAYPLVHVRL
jgi:hypothetical protein